MAVRTLSRLAGIALVLLACPPGQLAGTIGLAWNPSAGAEGYLVYYGPSPGQYTNFVDVGNLSQVTLAGSPNCTTSYFAVTAYNSAGESGPSNEVSSWPRPVVGLPSPVAAIQGSLLTLDLDGMNFQPGAAATLDNAGVRLGPASVLACDRLQVAAAVEPTSQGVRSAEVGRFSLTVTNPDQLTGVGARVFEVLINPARFDIATEPEPSRGRLDGHDTVQLARRFGGQDGDALYDPDADFNGDGWVDGEDLASLAGNFGRCWTGSGWEVSACSPSVP